MRTFSAPVVVSHVYSRHPSKQLKNTPAQFMQSIATSKVFKVLAAGELVGDKMPFAREAHQCRRAYRPVFIWRIMWRYRL
jgi:uncharacterized membrane protein